MANKTINTRISLKYDLYSNWVEKNTELLKGEIAIVELPSQNEGTEHEGKVQNPPTVLFKVGPGEFNSLDWVSAKAADVYSWAKSATAEGVSVKVKEGTNANETTKTLSEWIKTAVDKGTANAGAISSLNTKVDVEKVSTAISTAIETAINDLDATVVGTGNFVKSVVQENGKVTVTYCDITEADLPNISASKIIVTPETTGEGAKPAVMLDAKLNEISGQISALDAKQVGHTDDEIRELIDAKIEELDVDEVAASGNASAFISSIKQVDGKIVATKANLPEADASTAGIVKLGVTGGAATFAVVSELSGKVSNIESAIAGGVHFVGTVDTEPTESLVKVGDRTIIAGDVVIYDGKEYICAAVAEGKATWEQLGDVSRIGAIETAIGNMDCADEKVESQFVTKVSQVDGKITVERAQATSADIKHVGTTVKAELEAQSGNISNIQTKLSDVEGKVGAFVEGKIKEVTDSIAEMDFADPTADGNAVSFIDTISQEDGKITATKKTIPNATASTAGIAKLGAAGGAATYEAVNSLNGEVSTIKSTYVKYDSEAKQLCVGGDVLIFDCGGAE